MSNKKSVFLIGGIFIISLTYLVIYAGSDRLVVLTREDGLVENLGAIFFFAASVMFFLTFHRIARSKYSRPHKGLGVWFFLLLGLMLFIAFGEEISWGQRIFGIETPEYMRTANVQEEISIHNLELFYGDCRSGDCQSSALVTPIRLFALFGLVYMLILPWVVPRVEFLARLFTASSIPIPASIVPGILFVYSLLFCKALQSVLIVERNSFYNGMAELMEAFLALLILIMAIELYKDPYPKKGISDPIGEEP
jgi:hypothetical protein